MAWGDSWGSSPSRRSKEVAAAFYEGRALNRGDLATDGETVTYYRVLIARRIKPEDMAAYVAAKLRGERVYRRPLEFCFAHPDKATARHLCALGLVATYYGQKSGPEINGCPVDTKLWYTLEELKYLKPRPVVAPRVIEFRDNRTLPLFA